MVENDDEDCEAAPKAPSGLLSVPTQTLVSVLSPVKIDVTDDAIGSPVPFGGTFEAVQTPEADHRSRRCDRRMD
jgi:hypothetical protein